MMDASEPPVRAPASSVPDGDQELIDLLDATPIGVRSLRRGDVVEGVVVHVDRDEILVDVGTKAEAMIPAHESGVSAGELHSVAKVGDTIVAMVLETEDREGHAVLSLARAQTERGWRVLQHAFEENEALEAPVVDFNKGGAIVNISGVRGFVPLSQLVDLRQPGLPDETVDTRLARLRGKVLPLKVIEINRRRNRLILSERAAEQERRGQERDRLLADLQEGQTRTGRVSSICDFGVFVDLGGADGLVHLTELSWTPVANPSDVVKVGDSVDVLVLGVDRERKKIALSLKRLRAEPWEAVPARYSPGEIVSARITKLATFGAFAEIEPGVEGLIHISELSDERIQHPKSVVQEGEVVPVKILRIEPERRRLGLSLRQARAEAEAAETRDMPMVYGEQVQTPAEPNTGMQAAYGAAADSRPERSRPPERNREPERSRQFDRGRQPDRRGPSERRNPPERRGQAERDTPMQMVYGAADDSLAARTDWSALLPHLEAEPAQLETEPAESAAAEPTAAEPTAAESTAAESTAAEPTAVESEAPEAAALQPEAEPPAAEPTGPEPAETEPNAAEPTAAEPTAAEPTAAEPDPDSFPDSRPGTQAELESTPEADADEERDKIRTESKNPPPAGS
jgi:small subunit ribosomal protein S1